MLCFEAEVANEIGVNAAIVVQQLHYWTSKGYGRKIKGRVYIYNTYEDWREQFPFWSISTIKRIFKKLVENEIVFTYRKGYDRTSHWHLNYSNPIVSNWHNGSGQVDTMDQVKVARSIGTYPSQREQQNLPTVSQTKNSRSKRPRSKTNYRDKYPEADAWLEEQTRSFRQGVTEYLDYHVNNPKVKFPQAYRMAVIVEIWKKYTGQNHHTDFEYIDRSEVKPSNVPVVTLTARPDLQAHFDEEMQTLLDEGVFEWQR